MLRYALVISLMICAATSSPRAATGCRTGGPFRLRLRPSSRLPRTRAPALLKLLPAGAKLEDLNPSPIAGIYEFTQGAEVSYLTADGRYFIDGNLYDMKSRDNLTETLRTHARVAMINAVPRIEMLIFSPPNPKYTITVFTDVDCAYCRKLHSEMAQPEQARHPRTLHVLSAHGTRDRKAGRKPRSSGVRPIATRR